MREDMFMTQDMLDANHAVHQALRKLEDMQADQTIIAGQLRCDLVDLASMLARSAASIRTRLGENPFPTL